ncbi:MAG: four helix bundle protein [Polyangiaceae bacterium]|jgi:four helix bundle protein|nr:four helix bundle protein [Polyangiaceae bacterium]
MLRIYSNYLGVLRDLRQVLSAVEARDADLARQLRRAAASVALNMAEGSGNAGGTRRQRYLSALGSAREVSACLHVAEALGYAAVDPLLHGRLGAVTGVLVRLTR